MEQYDALYFEFIERLHRDKQKKQRETPLAPIEFFTLMTITLIIKLKEGEIKDEWAEKMKKALGKAPDLSGEGTTVGELVKIFGASMSSVSRKVTALEKKGFVERIPAKTDRRVIYLRLTETGRAIYMKEREKQMALRNYIRRGLGEDQYVELMTLANRAFDLKDEFYASLEQKCNEQE